MKKNLVFVFFSYHTIHTVEKSIIKWLDTYFVAQLHHLYKYQTTRQSGNVMKLS